MGLNGIMLVIRERRIRRIRIMAAATVIDFIPKLVICCYFESHRVFANLNNSGSNSGRNYRLMQVNVSYMSYREITTTNYYSGLDGESLSYLLFQIFLIQQRLFNH